MTEDPIVNKVIDQMVKRSNMGMIKYGKSIMDNNLSLSEWLTHAIEESLDQAIYMERIKYELDSKGVVYRDPEYGVESWGYE